MIIIKQEIDIEESLKKRLDIKDNYDYCKNRDNDKVDFEIEM